MTTEPPWTHLGAVDVGGRGRTELRAALADAGIAVNESAEILLGLDAIEAGAGVLDLASATPADLGLAGGGSLPAIFAAASEQGLALCPLATAPFLRLVHREDESVDPELRRHRPPDGALHVASPLPPGGTDIPTGFYLRTVSGQRWLRGYRCDADYRLPPDAVFVFALEGARTRL